MIRLRVSRISGGQLGLYLPKGLTEQLDLHQGDFVEVDEKDISVHRWSPERGGTR